MTVRGITVLVTGIVLTAAGWVLGYPELALLGVASLLASGFAVMTVRRRPQLDVIRHVPHLSVARGSRCDALLAVTNQSPHTFLGGTISESITAAPAVRVVEHVRSSPRKVAIAVGRISPNSQISIPYELRTDQRGRFSLGPFQIERSDPFRLIALASERDAPAQFVVHPRVAELLGEPHGAARTAPSRAVSNSMNSSIAFDSLRNYVIGDDLRRVHWRTSAKVGTLMVRETTDETIDDLLIVVDESLASGVQVESPDDLRRFEIALEIAASVAVHASSIKLPVRLVTTSGLSSGGSARIDSTIHVLDLLAESSPSPAGLQALLTEARNLRPATRHVFVTVHTDSDDRTEANRATAMKLSQRFPNATLIEVGHDAAEVLLGSLRIVGFTDLDSFSSQWISSS